MPKTSPFHPAPISRRALTLIEMLVGMAITLVMMAAVVNLFANISTGVNRRQGAMEISSELRIARQRLYNDLAGATVKTDAVDSSDGYLEIVEGQASDENPLAGSLIINPPNNVDPAVSLIPSSNTVSDAEGNLIDPATVTDFLSLGDYDDILALTVESRGAPFRGRGRALVPGGTQANPNDWVGTSIESRFAEVIWFAVENPADGSRGEPGMRTIYRRVLLIAPWVTTYDTPSGTVDDPIYDLTNTNFHPNSEPPFFYAANPIANTYHAQLLEMLNFQNDFDISVRLENDRIVPNTLADLSRREHRFAHLPDNLIGGNRKFPHPLSYNVINRNPSISMLAGVADASLNPISSLQPLSGDRAGADIVLSNVLGFDVQVFDPGAPLFNYQGNIIQPSTVRVSTSGGDGAFLLAIQDFIANPGGPTQITGFGAFADLGWNNGLLIGSTYVPEYNYLSITGAPRTLYQQERGAGWHPTFPESSRESPSVYDSWTDYYETDQINQENSPYYVSTNLTIQPSWAPWQIDNLDQGTNGLDDDGVNGPDDPMERETSPPYPTPLKGVQVKLRIYEPNTRAIREANVTRDMTD
ncbi:PilW family protein [Bythopirellula goksoeyrii]|uniref:Uncharacterized protein n=1 Tax=Bythopirellula goksoeyrii TaxID=1400387 RepID=A0A5B9Q1F8_9BACT|nr:prepilin-type N-terminal cleavage/methylation domain-containing protein [Bythopirellula goksoeyrii]QEG32808.1 hypothetical protein Pr1d_00680 [Bythopirellula goksoeyrii]